MTTERRTQVGQEVEVALGEVLAHVRGEVDLPCRIVDNPAAERILAPTEAYEIESPEVRRPIRTRRTCRAGMGTGAPYSRSRCPRPANRHRSRPRGGRACAQQVTGGSWSCRTRCSI